jgi:hypothetical protein
MEEVAAWGAVPGPEWDRLQSLLELARRAHRAELDPERRERVRERLLARLERNRIRRRVARVFLAAGASIALLAGLVTFARRRAQPSY